MSVSMVKSINGGTRNFLMFQLTVKSVEIVRVPVAQ